MNVADITSENVSFAYMSRKKLIIIIMLIVFSVAINYIYKFIH